MAAVAAPSRGGARAPFQGAEPEQGCGAAGGCHQAPSGRVAPTSAGGVVEYAPVKIEPVRLLSPRYLSEDERAVIAHERDRGATVREIAAQLGRSPSTVSRELRRNVDVGGRYRPAIAHR